MEEIIPECPRYYSRIFLVPKKNGKLRLIIDLSVLNHFVYTQTFKMETQRKVKDAVQLNDWAFSLDLTDAYLHIPIHHRSRKYLRFTLRGRVYQFKALPFGLTTSPFVFTRLMIVIATFLRRAITLHPYLDDWLARNQNRRRLLEHRQFILSLINSLGLNINYEKSDPVLAQVFTFIGMEFLTHTNIVRVPQARQMKILESVRMFSQKTPYPKCPPLQLFSARIPCGQLTDVHAEYWNTMSTTSARRQKIIISKKRADVRWNSCRTIMRTQRTSVGHSVPILRIRWNFMRTSAECPLDVRQNVRRTSARMSVGRP